MRLGIQLISPGLPLVSSYPENFLFGKKQSSALLLGPLLSSLPKVQCCCWKSCWAAGHRGTYCTKCSITQESRGSLFKTGSILFFLIFDRITVTVVSAHITFQCINQAAASTSEKWSNKVPKKKIKIRNKHIFTSSAFRPHPPWSSCFLQKKSIFFGLSWFYW